MATKKKRVKTNAQIGKELRRDVPAHQRLPHEFAAKAKAAPKQTVSTVIQAALFRSNTAIDVAKELRALAEVFDDVGPGHAAILRSFADRLEKK